MASSGNRSPPLRSLLQYAGPKLYMNIAVHGEYRFSWSPILLRRNCASTNDAIQYAECTA